jgi:succinate dehydrogenase / fumarate reductase membrane anchor subunit
MSMRTPLGRVRGLGSAREGTMHFWRQRLTAIANIPLTLFLLWLGVRLAGATHTQAEAILSGPIVATLLLLSLGSMLYHMRLGMQVIIEDYVHGEGMRYALIILNSFFTAILGAAGGLAVLKLAFGG